MDMEEMGPEVQRPELKGKMKKGGMLRNALLSEEEGDLSN